MNDAALGLYVLILLTAGLVAGVAVYFAQWWAVALVVLALVVLALVVLAAALARIEGIGRRG